MQCVSMEMDTVFSNKTKAFVLECGRKSFALHIDLWLTDEVLVCECERNRKQVIDFIHTEMSNLVSPSKLFVSLTSTTGHRSVLPECFDQWQEMLYVMGPPSAGWLRFPWQHKGTTHEAVVLPTQSTFNYHDITRRFPRCQCIVAYIFKCIEQIKTVKIDIIKANTKRFCKGNVLFGLINNPLYEIICHEAQ